MEELQGYAHIWVFDWEYVSDDGEAPEPVCLVAVDMKTGDRVRLWHTELGAEAPFSTGPESLFVCFSGAGDMGCFLHLGWPRPERVVDLYPEIRQQLYDRETYSRPSLINAARMLGLETMETEAKNTARDIIIERKFTDADRDYLLQYCEEDVELTIKVFERMYPVVTDSVPRWNGALLRGRYTNALALIEATGIPVDMDALNLANKHWETVKSRIVEELDTGGVYDGRTFKEARFSALCSRQDIPWPTLDTGRMDLSDDTFRQQAQIHGGVISNIREVRHTLGQMRLASYTIGRDGRNRVFLNPYGSVTGRNQPSNSKFLFGSARWVRSFIKPPEGHAVAYVDWKTQEVGIAAALSGDAKMWEDYNTGDIYMAFAKRAGLAPDTATKTTHGDVRSVCKRVVLGLGFGLTYIGLALQLGCKQERARQLVQLHEESYRTYHTWANQQSMAGALGVPLRTPFQWERRIKAGGKCNLRSLKNFYMQGTGAEMMRVAACMLTEAGISVCAPIHDAFLIEATIENATRDIAATTQIMSDASELVLGKGFTIGADVETVVTYPEIYRDAAGGEMYERVMKIAREADRAPCGQSQI